MLPISINSGDEEESMGEVEFRGEVERLESMIEDMAHCVYGLAKDDKSKAVAEMVASRLLTLSGVKFEKEEEPIRPRISRRLEGRNV
jgi:hypothetical protein